MNPAFPVGNEPLVPKEPSLSSSRRWWEGTGISRFLAYLEWVVQLNIQLDTDAIAFPSERASKPTSFPSHPYRIEEVIIINQR